MIRHLASLVLAFTLGACGDTLTSLVNAKFPPVDAAAQRQSAIDSAAHALGKLTSPNITVNVSLEDIRQALDTDELRAQGITGISISGNDQLIYVGLSFTREFAENDAGNDASARAVIAALKPKISGKLLFYMGVTAAVQGDGAAARHLEMRLLPGVAQIDIRNVELAGKSGATAAAQQVAALLSRYRDNITGVLTRAPFTRLSIPALDDRPFDFARSLKLAGGDFTVSLDGAPVTMPLKLDGVVWLIDDRQLRAMVQLSPSGAELPQGVDIAPTFNQIRHQFITLQEQNFGMARGLAASWFGIKKDVLALTMNAVANQSAACVRVAGSMHQQSQSKVELPDGSDMACTIERDCESDRRCSFEAAHDTRDCSTCLLNRPVFCTPRICVPGSIFGPGGCTGGDCTGGGCAQMGNDPICEVAKATQNQLYFADANLKKADCDRLRATETAACQVEVNVKKGLCDTAKAALQALSKTGNFANLDMQLDARSDNLQVCLRQFNLAPKLDAVSLTLDVTGAAQADLDLTFVPLDIVGHLTCQFPWTSKKTFEASLRESRIPVTSAIVIDTDSPTAGLLFNTDETQVKAHLSPSPIEYLLTSKDMTLACQGINLIKPLAISLVPFVQQLRGDFDYSVKRQSARVDVPLPALHIGGRALQLRAGQTPEALLVSATFAAPLSPRLAARPPGH